MEFSCRPPHLRCSTSSEVGRAKAGVSAQLQACIVWLVRVKAQVPETDIAPRMRGQRSRRPFEVISKALAPLKRSGVLEHLVHVGHVENLGDHRGGLRV